MRKFLLILASSAATLAQIIDGYVPAPAPVATSTFATTWPWERRAALADASGTVVSAISSIPVAATTTLPAATTSRAAITSATIVPSNSGQKVEGTVEKAAIMLAVVAGVAVWL